MNINSALELPTPKTVWVRELARCGQRRQIATRCAIEASRAELSSCPDSLGAGVCREESRQRRATCARRMIALAPEGLETAQSALSNASVNSLIPPTILSGLRAAAIH